MVSEGVASERTNVGSIAARTASIMIVWGEEAVTDIILFGSVARNEATLGSDVGLLIHDACIRLS